MKAQFSNTELAPILHGVSLSLEPGEVCLLIGPNGSGKTTLLKIWGGVSPHSKWNGAFEVEGLGLNDESHREWVSKVSYVGSSLQVEFPVTVREFVAMGKLFEKENTAEVERALARCDLLALSERTLFCLSGGELQRVLLARAFYRSPKVLLLDESFSQLDFYYFRKMASELKAWCHETGGAAVVVLHDRLVDYAWLSRVMALKGGKIFAEGRPRELLDPAFLLKLYTPG